MRTKGLHARASFILFIMAVSLCAGIYLCGNGSVKNVTTPAKILNGGQAMAAGISKWTDNGTTVYSGAQEQRNAKICSDNAGGAIICWEDYRSTTNWDLYAQHINGTNGGIEWSSNGALICNAAGNQINAVMCIDGMGGAIISWTDTRFGTNDIYVQRITAAGTVSWTPNGVLLCNANNNQLAPQICSDGQGGAIIAWDDYRNGNWDIFAQHVSSSGFLSWGNNNGTAICTDAASQLEVKLCSDSAGGAYLAWTDSRATNSSIYMQNINSTGSVKKTANGVKVVASDTNVESAPVMCVNGAGGCYIAWQEFASVSKMNNIVCSQIYSQGGLSGVMYTLCGVAQNQDMPLICADGTGGAIVAWSDNRTADNNFDVYVQRIDQGGYQPWQTGTGVLVSNAAGSESPESICSDGMGGAIIMIHDGRSGQHTYAQHVNFTGNMTWQANGMAISNMLAYASYFSVACIDGTGGAIITWEENRGTNDIYAQRVNMINPGKWTDNGIGVSTDKYKRAGLHACSDGCGGILMTWARFSAGFWQVYVQRFDASGKPLWTANGLPIFASGSNETQPQVCSDGFGGAIVVFEIGTGDAKNIIAQHVNYKGETMWGSPLAVCAAAHAQQNPRICSDGAGGAIFTWEDFRSATTWDIYAEHVDFIDSGSWVTDGVCVVNVVGNQVNPTICSDEQGGALIAWEDNRGADTDIYVQRLYYNGTCVATDNGVQIAGSWDQRNPAICSNGVGGALISFTSYGLSGNDTWLIRVTSRVSILSATLLSNAVNDQDKTCICTDGQGGAIIAWQDYRTGTNWDIYARRVNSAGTGYGAPNGTAILTIGSEDQFMPTICSDGQGGAIIAWNHVWTSSGGGGAIEARRLDSSFTARWSSSGAMISQPIYNQANPVACMDGAGGALVAWQDNRTGNPYVYIYAQHVLSNGTLPPSLFILTTTAPNPETDGMFNLNWTASAGCTEYSIYRYNKPTYMINGSLTPIAIGLSPSTLGMKITYRYSGVYYYTVAANNSLGQTLQYPSGGRMVNVTMLPGASVLTSTAFTPDLDGIFDLDWTPSTGATTYILYQYAHPITKINSSLTIVTSGSVLTYHEVMSAGGVYHFAVAAVNASGKMLSNSVTVTVGFPPGSFTLTSNAGSPDDNGAFDLTWTTSAGADNYTVYKSDHNITMIDGSVTKLTTTTSTSYSITGLSNGNYYYAVVANNVYGTKLSNSLTVTVAIPSTNPGGNPVSAGDFFGLATTIGVIMLVIVVSRKRLRRV